MSEYAKRTDSNQRDLVAAFRALGYSVALTHRVGNGFPDLVVAGPIRCPTCGGLIPTNVMVEVKTATGTLEKSQVGFHGTWRGPICVAHSLREVEDLVNSWRR